MTRVVELSGSEPTGRLVDALRAGSIVVVNGAGAGSSVVERLVDALSPREAASSSPLPLASAPTAAEYELPEGMPPGPRIALPNPRLCALDPEAARTVSLDALQEDEVAAAVSELGALLLRSGWQHVAVPGVAMAQPEPAETAVVPEGGWSAGAIEAFDGPANTSLDCHQTWARSRLDGITVVIDGACITDSPFTGTQQLVIEIARSMAATRPDATVRLATGRRGASVAVRALAGGNVDVVARRSGVECDVLYRPYQMLFAHELPFVLGTGRRRVIGQLDMIGYSNPFYHPSDQLWHFARNLQRHLMRCADVVTFISDHGRQAALAECPDLDRDRSWVVSCGADPEPQAGRLAREHSHLAETEFVLCLASTFAHKNRAHVINTFAAMVERYGYAGDVVLAGPEPYYGRSTDDEDAAIDRLPPSLRGRIHRLGHIDDATKWWLLRNADAVLYPSIVEGFGLVPFEAAAVGTLCLAHHSTAPLELLGQTGATIDSWDPVAWADLLQQLLEDDEARAQVLSNVQDVAHQHTWRRSAERTWHAIDRALALPTRSPVDEGGPLAAISSRPYRPRPGAHLRFNVVRGWPAIRRRLPALIAKRHTS